MTLTFALTILAAAVATYFTRIGGYLLMTTMSSIPPRVESALNAVPAAVLSALVAPSLVYGGLDITLTLIFATLIGLRVKSLTMLFASWAFIMVLRTAFSF